MIPQTRERMLAAPDLVDDYCLNLLDWEAATCSPLRWEIPYTSGTPRMGQSLSSPLSMKMMALSLVSAGAGLLMAGTLLSASALHLSSSDKLVRTLVGSLAWRKSKVLTSGGMESKTVKNDVRIRSRAAAQTYPAHTQEVCGLSSGQVQGNSWPVVATIIYYTCGMRPWHPPPQVVTHNGYT